MAALQVPPVAMTGSRRMARVGVGGEVVGLVVVVVVVQLRVW